MRYVSAFLLAGLAMATVHCNVETTSSPHGDVAEECPSSDVVTGTLSIRNAADLREYAVTVCRDESCASAPFQVTPGSLSQFTLDFRGELTKGATIRADVGEVLASADDRREV